MAGRLAIIRKSLPLKLVRIRKLGSLCQLLTGVSLLFIVTTLCVLYFKFVEYTAACIRTGNIVSASTIVVASKMLMPPQQYDLTFNQTPSIDLHRYRVMHKLLLLFFFFPSVLRLSFSLAYGHPIRLFSTSFYLLNERRVNLCLSRVKSRRVLLRTDYPLGNYHILAASIIQRRHKHMFLLVPSSIKLSLRNNEKAECATHD